MKQYSVCHTDIETKSRSPLKKTGLYKYSADLSTAIHCLCFSFDDGPVHLWIPYIDLPQELIEAVTEQMAEMNGAGRLYLGPECPKEIIDHARANGQFRAHNSSFERTILNGHAGQDIGFPKTRKSQWVCTAAKAAEHGLPRALGDAAKALGTYPKNEEGKFEMMQLAKPRKGKEEWYTPQNAPQKFFNLYFYCIDDVKAERDLDKHVPDISPHEQRVWEFDQLMNDRGIRADRESVDNVQFLIGLYKAQIEKDFKALTGVNPGQTKVFVDWVRAQGYDILDLQAPTVAEAVKDPKMPANVKKALIWRSIHASKAVAKYPAIQRSIMDDDRIRGMFLFYGGHPGRWSSMIVQLQNLFRGAIKDPSLAIEAYRARDLDWIKALYPEELMKVFASTVRGMFLAPPGKDLMAFDFSAIEARIVAWLAGQMDILEVFCGHGKIYEHTAAKIFGIRIEDVTPDQRFVGKIAVLALGYQGGQAAFVKMAKTVAAATGISIDISPDFAERIKNDWREANPKIVNLWKDLEGAARMAVENPGTVYRIPNGKIMFKVEGRWLYMRLPSGRRIAYYSPQMDYSNGYGGQVTYMGIDTYTRQWTRCHIYGGLILQNGCEGIGRDLLVNGVFALEEKGYKVIGLVHDEAITEIPEGFGSVEEGGALMCKKVKWAEGLPVAFEGWRAKRYKK